nr:PREDICTED: uncharacterized protein LOC109043389 isoform X1 [Bemisia tabaci]
MGAVASARMGQKESKSNDLEGQKGGGNGEPPKPPSNIPPEKAKRPVERRYSNVWAIRNRTRVLRSASVRDLESRWKNETGFFEEVLLTSPHQQPELIPRARLRQRTLLSEIFRDAILEEEWVSRLRVKGDKMSESPIEKNQDEKIDQQKSSNQVRSESGIRSPELRMRAEVITVESESLGSLSDCDTEPSTYATCCSECERSEDQNPTTIPAHPNNLPRRPRNDTPHLDGDHGPDTNNNKDPGKRGAERRERTQESRLHEAMNYQVKTNPKSGKKLEGEEMHIKITETKENIKAITTIHLFHTPDHSSEIEGNVSRKKRLFTPNKKPTETGSGGKYRKLFYELPDTSTGTHFAEEEFVYEPRFRTTTTKLVMKARSMINLNDEDQANGEYMAAASPDRTSGVRSSKSFRDIQRHKSEPDLDAIRTARESAKRFDFKDAGHCQHLHSESSDRVAAENMKNLAKDENRNILNLTDHSRSGTNTNHPARGTKTYDFARGASTLPKARADETRSGECWITGATFKTPTEVKPENFHWGTCPRRDRFCFYYPRKRNREIIDDELPDPDKVKDIRKKFEQTIKTEHASQTSPRPPCGNRKSHFNTWSPTYHTYPTVEITQKSHKLSESPKYRYWSDTTSVSSGVASDFSCETDSESSPRAETLDTYHRSESDPGQPVSADTLKKIRACGTSTTYYGGRVIACDKGTVRSPMTMTIMDEIRQNIKDNEVNLQLGIKSLQNKYSGMKFKLVKSNSCGSRLELTGTNASRLRRQNQQEKRLERLESVSENDLTNPGHERKENTTHYPPEDTNLDKRSCSECSLPQERKQDVVEESFKCSILQENQQDAAEESPPKCSLPQEREQEVPEESHYHSDYNSICLIENGEVQTSAQPGDLRDFIRAKGQSTRDIVKAFESAAHKEETPTAPWRSLVESRRQANRMAEVKRAPLFDEMEFEEFEVLDESAARMNANQSSPPVVIEQSS